MTAPDLPWYFNCMCPADMSEHEEDGFPSEVVAMREAEVYAFKTHGPNPGYRVRLSVFQDRASAPTWTAAWPNFQTTSGGRVRGVWTCDQQVDDETLKRITE